MSVKGKSNLSLFSSGVHGALEVTIRGEVITEEAVALGEGCGQCCSCRKRGGGGGVLGQGDTDPSGKAGEIPVYTLPMSVILAGLEAEYSAVCPSSSVVALAAEQNCPGCSKVHHVRSTILWWAGLKCPRHTGSWMELFFIFTSRERE